MVVATTATVVCMTGCITNPGVVMDKSKPIEQGQYTTVADTVSSTMWTLGVFGFSLPPIYDDTSSKEDLIANASSAAPGHTLYRKALKKAPSADALIEYSLDSQILNLYFFYVGRYTLTGTAVKTTK